MTFQEFQATGRDVDDIGEVLKDDSLAGIAGRVYCNDCLWIQRGSNDWSTVVGNDYFDDEDLTNIERRLYEFAEGEGYTL